ncbi:hypothetical protein [Streptomyces canus]|uniref:hypothetical protein n=1 Tax=Streptomyces canus TaxID=58343 RepID=UPI003243F326
MTTPDMAAALEAAFDKVRTENEAKQAAQLAADSVPTDNVTVLRERAERHAFQAVDGYWGYFNDIQTALNERVITPLLQTVARIAAERDRYRLAWQSAAFRAEARGEGIERIVKDRESYQQWLEQEQAVTAQLRAQAASIRTEALAEAKDEVVEWLVKKAHEGTEVSRLADKVERGAIRLFFDAERSAAAPVQQHFDKVPDPLDGCHWCACGNRWPCKGDGAVTG